MSKTSLGLSVSGKWQDTYRYDDGKVVVGEVKHNQIQDGAFLAVAGLLMNQFDVANAPFQTRKIGGIEFIDIGQGDPTWDDPAVTPAQPQSQDQLTSGFIRLTLDQDEVTFVPDGDPFNGNGVSPTPTTRIRIRVTLGNNVSGSLREFGLFCRETDDNFAGHVNEGLMFNWVIHPLIEKDAALTIDRVIEIQINRG